MNRERTGRGEGGRDVRAGQSKVGAWVPAVTGEMRSLLVEQMEQVLGRFVRFQSAGTEGAEVGSGHGHGLGLAICRSIRQLHGGSIRAENRGDGRRGLRVVVELPAG